VIRTRKETKLDVKFEATISIVMTETMNIIQEHKQLATHSVQLNVFSLNTSQESDAQVNNHYIHFRFLILLTLSEPHIYMKYVNSIHKSYCSLSS